MIRSRSVVRCMVLGALASAAGCSLGVAPPEEGAAPGAKVSKKPPVRVDNGTMRSYDVGNTFDLRPGDRVRIENGVLSRG